MKLAPDEFIRRFLLHTLPDGFHRIRHFGFMANAVAPQSSPCVSPLFSNRSSAPGPRPTRLRRVKQTSALQRAPNAAASCALSPRFCALQIEALQKVRHSDAIRHEDRWYDDEGHEPICRASAVDLLAGADTASLRPRSSLASGRSGNAVRVSARAMHIGSNHREHWRRCVQRHDRRKRAIDASIAIHAAALKGR